MADVSLSRKAFVKPLLHAAKYPHCAVNGLLLAERQKHRDGKTLRIIDAIPLFHSSLTLAPMMEVALTMIDGYCHSKGLVIAGYYHANENFQDSVPSFTACKIAEKIRDNSGEACLLMVDNKEVFTFSETVFHAYHWSESRWKEADKQVIAEDEAAEVVRSLVETRVYRDIVDFDNHLDDISLDWRNADIDAQIAECIC